MCYRRIDLSRYVSLTTARFLASVHMGLGPANPGKQKYWARYAFSAADAVMLLCMCAMRNDPFAKDAWGRICWAQKHKRRASKRRERNRPVRRSPRPVI